MTDFIDRRKGQPSRMTISQILDFMQHRADDDYGGDLQDNSVAIFNQLSKDDKKTFLRKSLMLHWENQINRAREGKVDVIVEDIVIDPHSIDNERDLITVDNYIEQRKFKNFMLKGMLTLILLVFCGMVAMTFVLGPDKDSAKMLLKNLSDMLSVMITFF